MDDSRFWEIIDAARRPTDLGDMDPRADAGNLRAALEPLSNDEVTAFGAEFYRKLCALNTWNLWGAGYVIAGGMSDDSFHYFRSWIVGKGKKCFDAALSDPESLVGFASPGEDVDNEMLEYVAVKIAEKRGIADPRESARDCHPDADPSGEPFDEDSVYDSYPKLAARFG